MMKNNQVADFVSSLSRSHAANVFNPWADFDPDYDVAYARSIRKAQLTRYLERRLETARILLVAEACGYQGGRFSGIAMTCERMLLGFHPTVSAKMIIGVPGKRTSRADSRFIGKRAQKAQGFNEPTDTVVWNACLSAGLAPEEFLLWNIFPFHPHLPGKMLTNRTPADAELERGLSYTKHLLSMTGPLPLFAVGKKSEATLTAAGFQVVGLRHPANGGANLFREGLTDALRGMGLS